MALRAAKDLPCVDCGQSYPFYVMDLDHVPERGPKLFNLGSVGRIGCGMAKLLAEIAKCDPVCANCHRIRSYERKQHVNV